MTIKKVRVKSVKKINHTGKVYDVVMKKNPHTFFANNILVHNSCYFRIIEAENLEQAEKIGKEVVTACDKKSIPALVTNIFNGFDIMRSDFEAISQSTLSYGKKKQYAFLKAWEDGETLPSPKLGITGLSIKRSDSPKHLSTQMKPFFIEIMKGMDNQKIKESMDIIEAEYDTLSIYDLSAKRSANNLFKYLKAFNYEIEFKERPFNIEKLDEAVEEGFDEKVNISDEIYDTFMRNGTGTYSVENGNLVATKKGELEVIAKVKMVVPFHIKASILYNYLLAESGSNDFNPIMDGEKVKLFYITPKKFNIKYKNADGVEFDMIQSFDCIAFPSNTKNYPDFINDFTPNKKRMLETYFFGKMETIFDVIEFNKERIENASMDLLF